jgi:hypothetical protein
MRQVGDTLVWLAMIAVVAAVVYFTPRVANYVASMGSEYNPDCMTCHTIACRPDNTCLPSY